MDACENYERPTTSNYNQPDNKTSQRHTLLYIFQQIANRLIVFCSAENCWKKTSLRVTHDAISPGDVSSGTLPSVAADDSDGRCWLSACTLCPWRPVRRRVGLGGADTCWSSDVIAAISLTSIISPVGESQHAAHCVRRWTFIRYNITWVDGVFCIAPDATSDDHTCSLNDCIWL